jgi:hypothetical protein
MFSRLRHGCRKLQVVSPYVTICRKPASYVANRTSAAVFTAVVITARAYGQQILNLPQICRHITLQYVAMFSRLRHIVWLPPTGTSAANRQVMSQTGNLLLYLQQYPTPELTDSRL